jgi:heat shock protein HslJ
MGTGNVTMRFGKRANFTTWGGIALCVVLAACGSRDSPKHAAPVRTPETTHTALQTPAPSLDELRNATYRGFGALVDSAGDFEDAPDSVTLVDGRWEGEPYDEDGASRPSVTFTRDFRLTGDLDADGTDDAVVLLARSSGGSGEDEYLAVVMRVPGAVRNVATTLLGDRVQVRSARIDGNRIVLNVIQSGDDDAMCCPGDLVTRTWTLTPDGLSEIASGERPGRLSIAVLVGPEWVLRWWGWDEAAGESTGVAFTVGEDGRMNGTGACNRFFAVLTEGDSPGDLTIDSGNKTQLACPDRAAATESRFFEQLNAVIKFGFVATQLALTYERDGAIEVMLFEPRPPAATNRD